MNKQAPIGIFDSGVGGLTVAREIMKRLPKENIIYFGDTARVPYGSKSPKTIIAYSEQITSFLLSKQVKAVVIACNTASALAFDTVKEQTTVPMIEVVRPGAKTAAETTRNGKVGVIATEGTIRSGVYQEYLRRLDPHIEVSVKACPLFVPLVEEGWINDPVTKLVVKRYIGQMLQEGVDTIVLGCTHYPLLADVIAAVIAEETTRQVALVNPACETTHVLEQTLASNGLLNDAERGCQAPEHLFYVSDAAEKFRSFANSILACEMIETKDVNIQHFE